MSGDAASPRKIVVYGDPVLHEAAREVTDFGDDLHTLVDEMFATLAVAEGVGLAAPQVGVALRVFVYDCPDGTGQRQRGHVVNPSIETSGEQDESDEGCLSVPGPYHELKRATHATVRGVDRLGQPVEVSGTGYFARCLQHETDHLNGMLYVDRLPRNRRRRVLRDMEPYGVERGVSREPLLALIRADVEATTHPNFKLYGPVAYWSRVLGKTVVSPSLRAVITYRISHALAARGLGPLAMLLRARAVRRTGAEIHPRATIGPGLFLVHSSGVVIGPDVVIGARARVHQGVTLGEPVHVGDGVWASSTVGDDVVLGAHAVVVGNVRIGDGARVGANAVVTKDVAAGTSVVGVPARVVGG